MECWTYVGMSRPKLGSKLGILVAIVTCWPYVGMSRPKLGSIFDILIAIVRCWPYVGMSCQKLGSTWHAYSHCNMLALYWHDLPKAWFHLTC